MKNCPRTFTFGIIFGVLVLWNGWQANVIAQSVDWSQGVEKVVNSVVAVQFKSQRASTTPDASQILWLYHGQNQYQFDPALRYLRSATETTGKDIDKANLLADQLRALNGPENSSIVHACGVVIGKNGIILATLGEPPQGDVTITLADSTNQVAKLLSYDEVTGCAIFQIDANGLTPVKLSDESISLGKPVAGVWTLGGQRATLVSQGIVSSNLRIIGTDETPVVETDIRIRKGAIGGALINTKGECVGLLRSMSSGSTEEGQAFAIPLNILRPLLDRTYDTKSTIHTGILGVTFSDESNRVSQVHEGSQAAKVGIQPGDRIVNVAAATVNTAEEARIALREFRAGDKLEVTWLRDNIRHRESVVLQSAEEKKNPPSEAKQDDTKAENATGSSSSDDKINEERWNNLVKYALRAQSRDLAPVLQVERTDLESAIQTLVKEMAALREELKTLRESKK